MSLSYKQFMTMDRDSNVGSPLGSDVVMEEEYIQFEAKGEILDTAFYEHSIQTANQLVQTHVLWWMNKATECITLFNSMKELLTLYT